MREVRDSKQAATAAIPVLLRLAALVEDNDEMRSYFIAAGGAPRLAQLTAADNPPLKGGFLLPLPCQPRQLTQPALACACVFPLRAKRLVQLQNSVADCKASSKPQRQPCAWQPCVKTLCAVPHAMMAVTLLFSSGGGPSLRDESILLNIPFPALQLWRAGWCACWRCRPASDLNHPANG